MARRCLAALLPRVRPGLAEVKTWPGPLTHVKESAILELEVVDVKDRKGDGSSQRHPQVLGPSDLDLSGLRAHCKEMHFADKVKGGREGSGPMPRANVKLCGWHWAQHWRRHLAHIHKGPWTLVRDRYGRTVGQIARPLGWWTGQEALTRYELNEAFKARIAEIAAEADAKRRE